MNAAAPTIDRDTKGRFRPGCSGNPAGKKTGTRNRATLLREALRDGEDATLARVVIDKALAGDAVAARFLLERLEPKPRGRPIHLDIPDGESPAGEVSPPSMPRCGRWRRARSRPTRRSPSPASSKAACASSRPGNSSRSSPAGTTPCPVPATTAPHPSPTRRRNQRKFLRPPPGGRRMRRVGEAKPSLTRSWMRGVLQLAGWRKIQAQAAPPEPIPLTHPRTAARRGRAFRGSTLSR